MTPNGYALIREACLPLGGGVRVIRHLIKPARITPKRAEVRLSAQTMTFDRTTGRRIDSGAPISANIDRDLVDVAIGADAIAQLNARLP